MGPDLFYLSKPYPERLMVSEVEPSRRMGPKLNIYNTILKSCWQAKNYHFPSPKGLFGFASAHCLFSPCAAVYGSLPERFTV